MLTMNQVQNQMEEVFGKPISSYSRAEAIEDGVLPASLYSGKKFAGGEAGRQTFPSPFGCGAVGSV